MRKPDFLLGNEADVVLGHHDVPRISGLPVGYFDEVPVWRHVQRAALIGLAVLVAALFVTCRS